MKCVHLLLTILTICSPGICICKLLICVRRRGKKKKYWMRKTGRTENSVFYYDDTDSDTETGENDVDDIHEKTVVSQEVSLLGKRYRDTSLQVQGDR